VAALNKKPMAILAGHGLYMMLVTVSGFLALELGVPGFLIGSVSLTLANLVSAYVIRVFLKWTHAEPIPVGETTTAVGQIR